VFKQTIEIAAKVRNCNGTWLAEPAKAAAVVGDHAMGPPQKSSGLLFPGIAV